MNPHLALAARIASEPPSRELDAEIALLLFPDNYVRPANPFRPGILGIPCALFEQGYLSICDAPKFTSSLDAAVSAVPEGWFWAVASWPGAASFTACVKLDVTASAPTACSALMSAILRAMAGEK